MLPGLGRLVARGLATARGRGRGVSGCSRALLEERGGALGTALVSGCRASAHELLFTFWGPLSRHRGPNTLQYGLSEHIGVLQSHADRSELRPHPASAWVFLNHAFLADATVYLRPVDCRHVDAGQGCVAVYANRDVVPGDVLSFDYTLVEWEMAVPFVCHATGRRVQGFRHLSAEQQRAALPFAWPHVRQLHDELCGLLPHATALGCGSPWPARA